MVVELIDKREIKDAIADVHILWVDSRPNAWHDQCIESVDSEPVNWYKIRAPIKSNLGEGRALGFQYGHTPFVSYVDDDDFVYPGAFEYSVEQLKLRPWCVSTYSQVEMCDENLISKRVYGVPWDPLKHLLYSCIVFHLHVYRRSIVNVFLKELRDWGVWEEFHLSGRSVEFGQHALLEKVLYAHREHNQHHASLDVTWEERSKAILDCQPHLLSAHKKGWKQEL